MCRADRPHRGRGPLPRSVARRQPGAGFSVEANALIITAVFARTEERYGARAERYVHLEAGHAAHGIMLQAISLGLGGTTVGAFDDEELQDPLALPTDHEPLYVLPIGVPA